MHRIKSIVQKAKTIVSNKDSIKAIQKGIYNYNNYNKEVEELAEKRMYICVGCEHFTDEPNDILKVEDNLIYQLDEKMCNDCGCALPYKTRQSIIICDKWQ